MRKVFSNSSQVKCVFTDEGVTFYGSEQEVYFPFGCVDSIHMSLMGILQATSGKRICSFAVDRKDRKEMKEMVKFAQQAIPGAPKAEVQFIDLTQQDQKNLVPKDLPAAEQLKRYKTLFIQGAISKEEYDAQRRLLKED